MFMWKLENFIMQMFSLIKRNPKYACICIVHHMDAFDMNDMKWIDLPVAQSNSNCMHLDNGLSKGK